MICTKVLLVILLLLTTNLFAQPSFVEHLIDTDFWCPTDIFGIDLDCDNDIDVLSSREQGHLAWWQNDGDQNFEYRLISSQCYPLSIHAVDIDNDNDIDVLEAGYDVNGPPSQSSVIWFENDGSATPNFTSHIIDTTWEFAHDVYGVNIDSDNDVDILGADKYEIAWFENDGNQNFIKHSIDVTVNNIIDVYALDVDNDNDVDIVGAIYGDNEIAWWENDGNLNFTKHSIDGSFSTPGCINAVDINNDNDVDVVASVYNGDEIAWWENNGSQNFTKHTISSIYGSTDIHTIDVDNDNDMDILSVAVGNVNGDNYFLWWNNDGNQSFNAQFIDTISRWDDVYALDVDDDTDVDILVSGLNGLIAWYENDLLGAVEETSTTIGAYYSFTTIIDDALFLPKNKTCNVLDITGRVVKPDMIRPGIYFIEIDGVVTQKVIKIR